jgi:DNA (cytosine-5)-methyltransferase 1
VVVFDALARGTQPLSRVRYFDAFAGIGGFALALRDAGHECVGFSEIDRHAVAVYQRHFPSYKPYGDITRIDAESLPAFDLLVGGFPCQSFSIAGKRGGFRDARGALFFELCRLAQARRPRLLLLENVKGLLHHEGGDSFAKVLSALDGLGYDAEWQVCNSRHFGVPQNRERVFLVGHSRGTPRPEVFPLTEGAGDALAADGEVAGIPVPPVTCQGGRNVRGAFVAHCLDANYWRGCNDPSKGRRTLVGALSSGGIRRLTPTECERLQGFPDDWTAGLSDTQRYRCLGNAVTVNVVRAIVGGLESC